MSSAREILARVVKCMAGWDQLLAGSMKPSSDAAKALRATTEYLETEVRERGWRTLAQQLKHLLTLQDRNSASSALKGWLVVVRKSIAQLQTQAEDEAKVAREVVAEQGSEPATQGANGSVGTRPPSTDGPASSRAMPQPASDELSFTAISNRAHAPVAEQHAAPLELPALPLQPSAMAFAPAPLPTPYALSPNALSLEETQLQSDVPAGFFRRDQTQPAAASAAGENVLERTHVLPVRSEQLGLNGTLVQQRAPSAQNAFPGLGGKPAVDLESTLLIPGGANAKASSAWAAPAGAPSNQAKEARGGRNPGPSIWETPVAAAPSRSSLLRSATVAQTPGFLDGENSDAVAGDPRIAAVMPNASGAGILAAPKLARNARAKPTGGGVETRIAIGVGVLLAVVLCLLFLVRR